MIAGSDDVDIPDDDIVKYLVQIDELNQNKSELEYMLQCALQSNTDKDKLMRGTEEIIEHINAKLELTSTLLMSQAPITTSNKHIKNNRAPLIFKKLPAFVGPDSVFERFKMLSQLTDSWHDSVTVQLSKLQKEKERIEGLKPDNQVLIQVEH